MGLTKYKLGELIERSTANNRDLKYGSDLIVGVNNEGVFTVPKGDPIDVDLQPYKIVHNGAFVYNPTRINLGSLAYRTEGMCIVSHLYIIFYLNEKGKQVVDPKYLYMYFHRKEFYREVEFRNFGSQRPEFSFNDMADIDIALPSIEQQRKFVNVYLALQNHLAAYQSKVEELKLVCDGYIEDLQKKIPPKKIGDYITESDDRNVDLELGIDDVVGVSIQKEFINTKADMSGVPLDNYKVIKKGMFVFNVNTARMGDKFAIALCDSGEHIASSIYGVFRSKDESILLPEFLMLFFKRTDFDRYVRFNSWGSAREVFTMDDMKEVSIPIPDINAQREIVSIFKCYIERQRIAAQLKEQLNNLCPILIKGSLQSN